MKLMQQLRMPKNKVMKGTMIGYDTIQFLRYEHTVLNIF